MILLTYCSYFLFSTETYVGGLTPLMSNWKTLEVLKVQKKEIIFPTSMVFWLDTVHLKKIGECV